MATDTIATHIPLDALDIDEATKARIIETAARHGLTVDQLLIQAMELLWAKVRKES